MCGRFALTDISQLPIRFGLEQSAEVAEAQLSPRFNIAPSQDIATVVEHDGHRHLQVMKWGFSPSWMKDPRAPAPINARSETLLEKAMFRGAVAHHRCLIPADGFYEWQPIEGRKAKQPMYAHLRDGALFGLAGLYTPALPDRGPTCTIITTTPNEVMAPIHNRMPVLLQPGDEEAWLDPDLTEPHLLMDMLKPYPAALMEAYAVPTLVSSVRNEGPELIARYIQP